MKEGEREHTAQHNSIRSSVRSLLASVDLTNLPGCSFYSGKREEKEEGRSSNCHRLTFLQESTNDSYKTCGIIRE